MPSDEGGRGDAFHPEVRPIEAGDRAAVASYLHRALNPRVPVGAWGALIAPPWGRCGPNSGFVLLHGGEVVGAYVAVYSERSMHGTIVPVCNLAAFCVDEGFRAHGLRLVRSLISQKGFDFTDLSPSGNVVAMNERLGFRRVEGPTRLSMNPWAVRARGLVVTDDPAQLERVLRGDDSRVYTDHVAASAARHLLVRRGDDYAYLVYRRDRRKRLPVFATPLYRGGSVDLLRQAWPAVGAALLRRGHLATLAEERILGFTPPGLGRSLHSPRPRMVRGDRLPDDAIDYLYSELALLKW
jgi:hypothetical protein